MVKLAGWQKQFLIAMHSDHYPLNPNICKYSSIVRSELLQQLMHVRSEFLQFKIVLNFLHVWVYTTTTVAVIVVGVVLAVVGVATDFY